MKISLLGYMGSGKSTIAQLLSQKLVVDYIDLDTYISKKENATISDIFKNNGEIYFRKKENYYLKEILDKDRDLILSVGGGTPIFYNNMTILNHNTETFYLQATPSTLTKRLKNEIKERPLIAHLNNENLLEFIAKHLFERNQFYQQADNTINTDNKGISTIVEEIITSLNLHQNLS